MCRTFSLDFWGRCVDLGSPTQRAEACSGGAQEISPIFANTRVLAGVVTNDCIPKVPQARAGNGGADGEGGEETRMAKTQRHFWAVA